MKKQINGKNVAMIAFIIMMILAIYKIPDYIIHKSLYSLGYDEETSEIIIKKKIHTIIIKNDYYSDFLKEVIKNDTYESKYLQIYLSRSSFSDDDKYLYERLKKIKGYSDEELIILFKNLDYVSLRPLVVFDKLDDIDIYIKDCKDHPSNTLDSYSFSNSYIKKYTDTKIITSPSYDTYISCKTDLKDFEPEKLVTISTQISIPNLQLESKALEAYENLCDALNELDMSVYAYGAYFSYTRQIALINMYKTEEEALKDGIEKPGFKDRQLGLSLLIKNDKKYNSFKDTDEYNWLINNAHKYGFIFRYPENKEAITGYPSQDDYLRYVGVELAEKIYSSKMSFDEYYYMYLYTKD